MRFAVLGIVLFVSAYALSILLYVNNGAGRPHVLVRGPSVSDGTRVAIDAEEIKTTTSELVADIRVAPGPALLDPATHALKEDLSIFVSSTVTVSKHTWQKGELPDLFRVSLAVEGEVADWPFDEYRSGPIVAELVSGAAATPVPATVTLAHRLLGWTVKVSRVSTDSDEVGPVRVDLHRSPSTMLAGVAILGVLITLASLGLFVAIQTLLGRRKFQPPMTTWYAAMLFAVMPLRNALPDAPPFGSWIDVAIVTWVIVALVTAMVLYIVCWWQHLRPDPPEPAPEPSVVEVNSPYPGVG